MRPAVQSLAKRSRRNARRVEIKNCWEFEAMTFISHEDMERVSAPTPKYHLPLCFPIRRIEYDARPKSHCDMFWMGGFGWYPNLEGVLWFLREIFPLLRDELAESRIRLHFLGSDPRRNCLRLPTGTHTCTRPRS